MRSFFRAIIGFFGWMFSLACTLVILGVAAGVLVFNYYSQDLPDYRQLARYDPPTVTRLYAADGRVLAEYATQRRVFVPLKAMPRRVAQAFIAAEDKNFYEHTGVDLTGVARAVRDNIVHYGKGRSLVGGSTITQQVVKNFLLTNEKSIERKIKEAILALRITRMYDKEKILELYLNEIYLGLGSYGVAAAAQSYFDKSLDELTVADIALLAAQPKAPASYDPRRNPDLAKTRRNWVIERMREDHYITDEEASEAKATPIELHSRDTGEVAQADFFAEEVRRLLAQMYGQEALYEGGLVVKTTLDPALQKFADDALRQALLEYDRRHGYRGPLAHVGKDEPWKEKLLKLGKEHAFHIFDGQKLAVVVGMDEQRALIAFDDESRGVLPLALLKWAKADIRRPSELFKVGDVVLVRQVAPEQKKLLSGADQKKAWDLLQIPEINGAMMALDPHTGRILAMSGGYAYGGSEFNRATQARRQPGSAFKPFVYLAGLENGFTPTTLISDEPIEIEQGPNLPLWQPQNFEGESIGDGTMRLGLEKSRNTMTVRMAQIIGLDKAMEAGKRFGIYDDPRPLFSMVLGSAETTLIRLVTAYGMLADGGRRIAPAIIERIDDRHGNTIYRRDNRTCLGCLLNGVGEKDLTGAPPMPEDTREQVADPRVVYQIVSMLEGVTKRGTGARAREIGKVVAGKTGTTNDSMDAWFIGFTPDLVVGVYVGFDKPRPLGPKETGASVALPAFIDFMKDALKDRPNKPFRIPRGIQLIKVDLKTGTPVTEMAEAPATVIDEAFITGAPIYVPGVTAKNLPENPQMNLLQIENEEPGAAPPAEPPPIAEPPAPEPEPIPQYQPPPSASGGLY